MQDFWNQRYTKNETVYGNTPNSYFKTKINSLKPSNLLLPAEGEGRNAVYAATKGWKVTAFDYSEAAMQKALANAKEKQVNIDYRVIDLDQFMVAKKYDAIGLIYVHLFPKERAVFHQKIMDSLTPGGVVIIEAFSKEQINNSSGGPKNIEQLFSADDLKQDFEGLDIIELETLSIILNEGPFHQGNANVIRMLAKKSL